MVRSHVHPARMQLSRRFVRVSLSAVAALALSGVPAAHGAVTDDVAGVTSEVESVTEAVTGALPDTPVPIETPGVPKVPPPPPPSASKPPPRALSSPSATNAVETAVRDLDGGAGEAARATSEVEGASDFASPGTSGEPGVRAGGEGRPGKHSIGPAAAAPPLRWRAYVWPAIALRVGDAVRPLLASIGGLTRIRVPDVFGLFSSPEVPGSTGIDRPSKRSGQLGQDLQSPSAIPLPSDGMGFVAAVLIGLLVMVGLLALTRLVVGEELFEGRHWRGHRG